MQEMWLRTLGQKDCLASLLAVEQQAAGPPPSVTMEAIGSLRANAVEKARWTKGQDVDFSAPPAGQVFFWISWFLCLFDIPASHTASIL